MSAPSSARVSLYDMHKDILDRQEKRREALQKKECPFRPAINRTRIVWRKGSVFKSLYPGPEKIREQERRRSMKLDERFKSEHPFKPTMTATASVSRSQSARSTDEACVELYRQGLRQQERHHKESGKPRYSFEPVLSRKSRRIVARKERAPTVDRLYAPREQMENTEHELEDMHYRHMMEECTFAPDLSASTRPASARASANREAEATSPFERLYGESKKRATKLRQKQLEKEKESRKKLSFHPKIATRRGSSSTPKMTQAREAALVKHLTAARTVPEGTRYSFHPAITPGGPERTFEQLSAGTRSSSTKESLSLAQREAVAALVEEERQKRQAGGVFNPPAEAVQV